MKKTPHAVAEHGVTAAAAQGHNGMDGMDRDLHLLLEWPKADRAARWRASLGVSICLHFLIFVFGTRMASFVHREPTRERLRVVRVTPLYLPPDLLTQKAPNRGHVSKQIDLASLIAPQRAQQRVTAPRSGSVRKLEVPGKNPQNQSKPQPPRITAEAPNPKEIDQTPSVPQGAPDGLVAQAPPPPTPAEAPIVNSGIAQPAPNASPRLAPPKNSLQDVIRSMAHDPNGSHLQISDDGNNQPLPTAPGRQPNPGHLGSALELKSDPQGADFRPYLAQILTIVRRNWFSVLPESARMGLSRGHTVIQFVVNHDGSIPKLVIASASGLDSLDRAAVAGLSMSNPLPALPSDFKGPYIKLQLSFNYNSPSM